MKLFWIILIIFSTTEMIAAAEFEPVRVKRSADHFGHQREPNQCKGACLEDRARTNGADLIIIHGKKHTYPQEQTKIDSKRKCFRKDYQPPTPSPEMVPIKTLDRIAEIASIIEKLNALEVHSSHEKARINLAKGMLQSYKPESRI
jgi:hypothetical protein